MTNPRSFQPSGPIVVTSLDTDFESQIDSGYNQQVTMALSGQVQSLSLQQGSFVNGAVNNYTFSMQTDIPVLKGDKFSFKIPAEVSVVTATGQLNCTGRTNVLKASCYVKDNVITSVFEELNATNGVFSWEISGIRNPSSTKTSSGFSNIMLTDSKDFLISKMNEEVGKITNKYPASIFNYSIW